MKNDSTSGRRWSVGLALLLPLMLLSVACDSSSGGSPAELCIEFQGTSEAASGTVFSRMAADSTCNLVEIEIVASNINDVFAFQSQVNYDPDTAAFLGFSLQDSVLESGADVTVVADEEIFGVVTIGATRIGSEGVDISGEGILLKLAFGRFAIDGRSGEFELDTNCLLSDAAPPTVLNATCSGGTLFVR